MTLLIIITIQIVPFYKIMKMKQFEPFVFLPFFAKEISLVLKAFNLFLIQLTYPRQETYIKHIQHKKQKVMVI